MSEDTPIVDYAILQQVFEFDVDAPTPFSFSSELIGSFFASTRSTLDSMKFRCILDASRAVPF
jgi:hypothetical protein